MRSAGLVLLMGTQAFLIIADGDELQADLAVARNMTVYQQSMAKRKRRLERAKEALGSGDVLAVFGPMDEASWETRKTNRRRKAVRYGDNGIGTDGLSPATIFRQLGVSPVGKKKRKRRKRKEGVDEEGEGLQGARGGGKSGKIKLDPLPRPMPANLGEGEYKASEPEASAGWIGADFAHGGKTIDPTALLPSLGLACRRDVVSPVNVKHVTHNPPIDLTDSRSSRGWSPRNCVHSELVARYTS